MLAVVKTCSVESDSLGIRLKLDNKIKKIKEHKKLKLVSKIAGKTDYKAGLKRRLTFNVYE